MDGTASDNEEVRLRLARELRRLRKMSAVSGRELARRIAVSQSKVSRIESGAALPTLAEVTAWSEALDATQEVLEELVSLTRSAIVERQTWDRLLEDTPHLQDHIRRDENSARRVRTYQPSIVPGLLQTAEYARRVFSFAVPPYTEEALAAAVAGRMARQSAVYEEGRRFDFLITEAALRWRPGPPKLLLGQLDRLASVISLADISLGLIPHDREATAVFAHSFVIYDNDESDRLVSLELLHGPLTVDSPDGVEIYERRWSRLSRMAVFDDDARDHLSTIAEHIKTLTE